MNQYKNELAAGTGKSIVMNRCQVCSSRRLNQVLFLGYMPPVNQLREIDAAPFQQSAFPTLLLHCRDCELVQLGLSVDPIVIFPEEYPYTSGTTRILRENFEDLYRRTSKLLKLSSRDLIIDIGSNDGTLLSNYQRHGHRVLGIEPTGVGAIARTKDIETLQHYFSSDLAVQIRREHGPARLVTATNCFAHMEGVHLVMEGIIELIGEDGIFVSENHYLISLLDKLQYDTIYHEHLRYYSLTSLSRLLAMHGLEVFQVDFIPTHGGSIRVYSAVKGRYPVDSKVGEILASEPTGDDMVDRLNRFKSDVVLSKLRLHSILCRIKEKGGRICGISAPSRASTLINYVGLDDGILDFVAEIKGSLKIGKYLPGTIIPVVEEERLFNENPEYALVLSWHIADELTLKIRKRGFRGKFIVPLPEPMLIK